MLRPDEELLAPVHAHVVVHVSCRHHLPLRRIPVSIVCFAAFQLDPAVQARSLVLAVLQQRVRGPFGQAVESVVGIVEAAKVARQLAPDDELFQICCGTTQACSSSCGHGERRSTETCATHGAWLRRLRRLRGLRGPPDPEAQLHGREVAEVEVGRQKGIVLHRGVVRLAGAIAPELRQKHPQPHLCLRGAAPEAGRRGHRAVDVEPSQQCLWLPQVDTTLLELLIAAPCHCLSTKLGARCRCKETSE
mmetsp:Transcript_80710/g.261608  ORF Transcript_80710/g.261608 Transcript_80710/m.261608 type:complete len:248 (+) Transcript_80710:808-1551(+)